ncbi:MAG: PQQ-dependent sugar dehydrogenase, partial [Saprospiraceae bacterium]
MKKNIFLTALTRAVVMLVVPTCSLFAADLPPGFAEKAVAEGLNPTAMAMAPDGSLFLAQKDGRVLLLHDDELHTEPFLTLAVDDFNERGLEGIAVHPNFGQEPWVYLYYTVPGASRNRVSRVLANGGFAVPGSEQVLLELDPMNGAIHNGGALVFGPDGCLYIGVGDGSAPAKAQNLNTVLGKILRLNPDGSIPASNPFYGQLAGNSRAIFASGVRNPFSMACDPATGKILFCDVGLGSFEEVNELKPGKNYGWSIIEGPLNGQTPPADYQDPFFAYPHGPQTGCAVVGAAFGLGNQPGIPPTFQRRFFFADYCSGWIRTLDPTTGMLADTFATGIDRPVSLLVGPVGELYYFARAGLGGGSPGDNTASVEGTLWKVFWVGDSTPLVAGHPRDAHVAAGETALFSAKAFGAQPITYQWLINAMPVPGADSSVLALANTMPTDSGAQIVCVAANLFGSDTSHTAVLRVTDGKRPLPEILLPFANTTYRCGDTIFFRGRATDPDEGLLADSRLTWRVDFHHAAHTHPALPTIAGVSEGMIAVPTVGETAADVFFRIHLTATDTTGLSRSAALDVLPKLTKFFLDGPPGLPVNINGQIRPLPADVSSVIGMQHSLLATLFFQNGDTLFYFRDWENGSTETLRTVYAAETPDTLAIRYDRIVLGNGTGLHGAYFFDPLATLPDPPALVRTDTTIHFDWGEGTPDSVSLPSDYFTVRWTGFVEPVFGETYQFHIRSDDGARLWVGDSLLLDQWVPQVITEHSGSIFLKNGVRYPIRLEYLEIGGGALAELRWSSARQVKQIVPKRQLYPPDTLRASTVTGTVGIDQNLDGIWSAGETLLPNVEVALYAAANDSLLAVKKTLGNGRYRFDHLLPEAYYLRFRPGTTAGVLAPSENVDTEGFTAAFNLAYREIKTLNAAWIVDQAALYGSVWLDENRNDLWDVNEHGLDKVGVLLYRGDSTLAAATATNADGGYLFPLVPAGAYFLWFSNHLVGLPTVPGFGLDSSGRVPFFDMNTGESRAFVVAFRPEEVSATDNPGQSVGRLRTWPNPASEKLYIALESDKSREVLLEIFDLHGRGVFQKKAAAGPGTNVWELPVGQLLPGLYA